MEKGIGTTGGAASDVASASAGSASSHMVAAVSQQQDEEDLAVVPHEGFLFLDCNVRGEWVLTHTVTYERYTLPALQPDHAWILGFDDEGFGCVVQTMDDEEVDQPVFAEDVLKLAPITLFGMSMVFSRMST
jgi:hypothetical protein